MPGESLKSKLDGNELDLSLSGLTSVPVKELVSLPKATNLDFSCNLLTFIEPDFCSLIHLVKLDLSKNQLTALPENFGDLQKLQHLDLYNNKLTTLPLTFCRLNALKWLDIRDNPLRDSGLLAAAGDCLSDAQCRNCAKQVVSYMKKVQSDHERERQKMLKEQREKEALRKAEEELELQRKRTEKKADKERRRQQATKKASKEVTDMEDSELKGTGGHLSCDCRVESASKSNGNGLSLFQLFLTIGLLLVAVLCGLYVYCLGPSFPGGEEYCTIAMNWFRNVLVKLNECYDTSLKRLKLS